LNPGLRIGRPVTNCLSHGTALLLHVNLQAAMTAVFQQWTPGNQTCLFNNMLWMNPPSSADLCWITSYITLKCVRNAHGPCHAIHASICTLYIRACLPPCSFRTLHFPCSCFQTQHAEQYANYNNAFNDRN
jgi:hypothetical protein